MANTHNVRTNEKVFGNFEATGDAVVGGDLTVTGNLIQTGALSFSVYLTANTAGVSNVPIVWDAEEFDTDNAVTAGIFTTPANKGGKYLFSGTMQADAGVNTVIYKNNALFRYVSTLTTNSVASYAILIDLAPTDTIDVRIDGTPTIAGNSGNSTFQGHRIV